MGPIVAKTLGSHAVGIPVVSSLNPHRSTIGIDGHTACHVARHIHTAYTRLVCRCELHVTYVTHADQDSLVLFAAGFAGSRSGALIASAWAALVHQGEDGYLSTTKQLMEVSVPGRPAQHLHRYVLVESCLFMCVSLVPAAACFSCHLVNLSTNRVP